MPEIMPQLNDLQPSRDRSVANFLGRVFKHAFVGNFVVHDLFGLLDIRAVEARNAVHDLHCHSDLRLTSLLGRSVDG